MKEVGWRDILDHMKEMKDMYRLARYVDSEEYEKEAGIRNGQDAINDCARRYAEKQKMSAGKASQLIESAIERGYLRVLGDNTEGVVLDITPIKGMQLVSKWFIWRQGLGEQTMQTYPETKKAYRAIAIALVGVAGTIIGSITTVIVTHLLK